MRSNEARIALIREAIDDVAARLRADAGGQAGMTEVTARLAGIWAMVAELDPALASSLSAYEPPEP